MSIRRLIPGKDDFIAETQIISDHSSPFNTTPRDEYRSDSLKCILSKWLNLLPIAPARVRRSCLAFRREAAIFKNQIEVGHETWSIERDNADCR